MNEYEKYILYGGLDGEWWEKNVNNFYLDR